MSKYPGTDGNMNSVQYSAGGNSGPMNYGMMPGGGGNYPSRMPPGGGELKKGAGMVTNSMCYREQPRPKSPHRFQPQMNTILDDFDPDSPGGDGGYNDDRIHNDLLEEICSDIGIRDTMDLDFLDFDGSEAFTKLPVEDGDCFDHTIPFGQYPDGMDGYRARGGMGEKLSVNVGGFDGKNASDSIASPTVSSTSPHMHSECPRPSSIGSLGSPAVHSTTHAAQGHQGAPPSPIVDERDVKKSGGLGSRASSFDSLVDSPATVIAAPREKDSEEFINLDDLPPYNRSSSQEMHTDASKLKNLKEYGTIYGRGPPTPFTVVPSPMKNKGKHGYASIKTEDSAHNSSFDHNARAKMQQFKPVQSPSVGTTVATTGVSTSLTSRPPQASLSSGNIYSSVKQEDQQNFKHPAPVDEKPPRSAESPFDLGYASMGSASVCTESFYGSMTSLDKMSTSSSADMGSKEKVLSYLHKSIPPNIPNFIPPIPISQSASAHVPGSGASSLPDSPPQERVAKRARTINSGTDLLDCMREQYSFVKGADMYAKPKYPSVPVQRARPTPYAQQGGHAPSSCGQEGMGGQPNLPHCQQQQQSNVPYPGPNPGQLQDRTGMVSPNPLASAPVMTSNMAAPAQGGYGAPSSSMMNHSMSQRPMGGASVPQSPCNSNPYARNNGYGPSNDTNCNMGMTSTPTCGNFPGRPGYDSRPPVARPRMAAQEMGSMMHGRPNVQQFQGQMQQQQQQQQHHGPNGPNQGGMSYSQHYNQSQFNGGGTQLRHKVPHSGAANQNPQNCYGGNQWQQEGNNMHGAISQSSVGHPMSSMSPVDANMSAQMGSMTGHRPSYPMGPQYNQQQPINMQQQPEHSMQNMQNMHQPMGGPQMRSQQQPMNRGQMNPMGMPPQGSNAYPPPIVPNQQLNTPGMGSQPPSGMTPQQGLMHHIITDKSNSFRSHPLFPLLRDLIIADMNFHSPSFPFQLIANLPADFDKLLQNYMNRNPSVNYQSNDAVNGVLMDALKYAHRAIIEKIKVKKQQEGYKEPPRPLSAIEDFCERFDKAVRNSMDKPEDNNKLKHHPASSSLLASKSLSASMPLHPLKSSSPAPDLYPQQASPSHGSSSLPCTPSKTQKSSSRTGDGDVGKSGSGTQNGGGGKNKVLPKEAVAVMLSWLREHQDNPYPNDDEKEMLINKTKLTINQINYWFTNARRRILPKWALQRYMEQQQQQHQYASQMHMLGAPH